MLGRNRAQTARKNRGLCSMTRQSMSKKQQVIAELYSKCKTRGDFAFSNQEVRKVCADVGFGNHFDATKWDHSEALPAALTNDDMFVVHLGGGRHQFVPGIKIGYPKFEPVSEEHRVQWRYRSSLLNNVNTSESNILSVGYNQRIIHDFLYEDISANPKVYGSNRTKISLDYQIGGVEVSAKSMQVEIDLTTEHLGSVTIFEAKNGFRPDFNVFQLFNPYRYFNGLRDSQALGVTAIECCYLLRHEDRLRLYLYRFDDAMKPGSIRLLRNAEYVLVQR